VSTGGGGRGDWKHNPEHRKGVSYRDKGTAQKFDRGASSRNVQSREAFRGRAEAGRQDIARGGADQVRDRSSGGRQDLQNRRDTGSRDRSGAQQRRNTSGVDRSAAHQSSNKGAFGGYEQGSKTRNSSNRGHQSMSSSRAGGSGRSTSGGGGRSRGGGGGRGGGGRRR